MKTPEKNPLEWTVFAVSAALIALVVGALVHAELTTPDTPPDLAVRTLEARQASGGYVVEVEVTNTGGRTAANAEIEVTLTGGGGEAERREVVIAYVPRGSAKRAEVVFSGNPALGRLQARATGYETQ